MFNDVFFLLNAFTLPPILRYWEQAELRKAAEFFVHLCKIRLQHPSVTHRSVGDLWLRFVDKITLNSYVEALDESQTGVQGGRF